MLGIVIVSITIYLSGLVLYSSLFIFSSNQDSQVQIAKMFVAGLHSLILIVPVLLAQSRQVFTRVFGYSFISVYFLYAFFLVGYFPYFGFVPEVYAFDLGSIRDLSEVSNHYFLQIFGWRETSLILIFILMIWQIKNIPIKKNGIIVLFLPLSLFATSVSLFGSPAYSDKFGNVTVIRRFGPFAFSYISISEMFRFKDAYLADNIDFPGKISTLTSSPASSNQAFVPRIPQVSRVTLVQIESFDGMAIDATLSGVPVMPFVSDLQNNCLNYQNFLTTKGPGGSSDSEFSVATGLVPSPRLPSLKHFDFTGFETLYDRLQQHGIASKFAHNNQSGFYGRKDAYAQIEALEVAFMPPGKTVTEIEFARMSLEDTLRSTTRSFHYFFNFQSHGPYQGYLNTTEKKFSINRFKDIRVDYLATMNEIDNMVHDLFNLQSSGFYQGDNLFIITSDHPSGLHSSDDLISRYRIPAMICHRSFQGADIPNLFSSIDLYPTILEAFGIPEKSETLGQSMFWDVRNAVLLPQQNFFYRDSSKTLRFDQCSEACEDFFRFTEQYIKY